MVDQDKINEHLNSANEKYLSTVELARDLLDSGNTKSMTMTMKKEIVMPVHWESPRRYHTVKSLVGFLAYLQKYGSNDTVILANPNNGNMMATLDEAKKDGFEMVSFHPEYHPLFAPWRAAFDCKVTPKELIPFLTANKSVISDLNARDIILALSQLKVSKKLTIMASVGSRSLNGIMCETTIKGVTHEAEVELPEIIHLSVPIFCETPYVDIEIDVMVEEIGEEVKITLTSSDSNVKRIKAIEEMVKQIQGALPDAVASLGQIEYSKWDYIGR